MHGRALIHIHTHTYIYIHTSFTGEVRVYGIAYDDVQQMCEAPQQIVFIIIVIIVEPDRLIFEGYLAFLIK